MAGLVAPCSAWSTEGLSAEENVSTKFTEVIGLALAERGKMARGMDGAQHVGTVRGLGGMKATSDLGSNLWLADRRSEAVVNVIAKETANRSCRAE